MNLEEFFMKIVAFLGLLAAGFIAALIMKILCSKFEQYTRTFLMAGMFLFTVAFFIGNNTVASLFPYLLPALAFVLYVDSKKGSKDDDEEKK